MGVAKNIFEYLAFFYYLALHVVPRWWHGQDFHNLYSAYIKHASHYKRLTILSISTPRRVVVLSTLSYVKVKNCTLLPRFPGHSVATRKKCEMLTVQRGEYDRNMPWGIVLLLAVHLTAKKTKIYFSCNYQKLNALLKGGWTTFDGRD